MCCQPWVFESVPLPVTVVLVRELEFTTSLPGGSVTIVSCGYTSHVCLPDLVEDVCSPPFRVGMSLEILQSGAVRISSDIRFLLLLLLLHDLICLYT